MKNIKKLGYLINKNLSACLAYMVFHVPFIVCKDLLNTCIISNVQYFRKQSATTYMHVKMSKSARYPLQTLTTIH
jgi:hypothetical protein